MNIKDFVVLPGSKAGTSVRLKAKNVRELKLEKVQLELENKEMEKKLQQLQSNMNREKEERKKSRAFHWRNGQAGPMTIQARLLSQKQENSNKVSSGKVTLKMLKEQIQEPVKQSFKGEVAKAVASETPEMKGAPYGQCETNSVLLPAESVQTGLKKQETGLLLQGAFNEEESTQSFQEALMQWRNRYCDHRTALNSSEVLPASVGVCEVQTHLTLMKEPIQVEFKADGLSYMEKLLLKKHRRTPINEVSSNQVNDLRPVQALNEHQAAVFGEEGGGKGDDDDSDDDDYSTVEDMKRYWAALFKEKEPNIVSERAESSLKIEILDGSYDKDLDQSSNFLVMEAGAMGMNKQRKTEPLKQSGRYQKCRDYLEEGFKSLQEVARREKCVSALNWGLEGFFALGVNPKQGMPKASSSLCADLNAAKDNISFSGDGKWTIDRGLSEYADDSVVQDVLENQLNRSSNLLERQNPQNRMSALMAAYP
ncbi:PREDICTED: zinc finger B-box domain-containing protein 1, partial [Tinamus guttatus]|uniref:zinc finger B-box domain-containing protein 1 n=1 Tax=Tinamus guttatus TaxID=94827 RepID=UPI00052EB5F0